jgi:hypothetical protein
MEDLKIGKPLQQIGRHIILIMMIIEKKEIAEDGLPAV